MISIPLFIPIPANTEAGDQSFALQKKQYFISHLQPVHSRGRKGSKWKGISKLLTRTVPKPWARCHDSGPSVAFRARKAVWQHACVSLGQDERYSSSLLAPDQPVLGSSISSQPTKPSPGRWAGLSWAMGLRAQQTESADKAAGQQRWALGVGTGPGNRGVWGTWGYTTADRASLGWLRAGGRLVKGLGMSFVVPIENTAIWDSCLVNKLSLSSAGALSVYHWAAHGLWEVAWRVPDQLGKGPSHPPFLILDDS